MTVVKEAFLYRCSSLKTISNMSALSNVTRIEGYFLLNTECSSKTDVCDFLIGSSSLNLASKGLLLVEQRLERSAMIILTFILLLYNKDFVFIKNIFGEGVPAPESVKELILGSLGWYSVRECFTFLRNAEAFVLLLLLGCYVEALLPYWAVSCPVAGLVFILLSGLGDWCLPEAVCSTFVDCFKFSPYKFFFLVSLILFSH
eukprot:TRINITY_DN3807_c0_g3_i1.p1 TRINITY_DN3807_c0_g3~~TRINITY_DN3807_c0_g3_i1.p1  ORF type:complete len:202 (+),score=11.90 TRINITY_DN3807_c0_g3_i1:3-608(+)